MAYEMKDGQFNLFKNKRHEPGDNKPVMTGKGMWRGQLIEFAVWTKVGKESGEQFFSGQMQEPKTDKLPPDRVPAREELDDEIPF